MQNFHFRIRKSSTKFNLILNCGKHFSKGVLEKNGRIKNVLEFDVEKDCEYINKDYPYK